MADAFYVSDACGNTSRRARVVGRDSGLAALPAPSLPISTLRLPSQSLPRHVVLTHTTSTTRTSPVFLLTEQTTQLRQPPHSDLAVLCVSTTLEPQHLTPDNVGHCPGKLLLYVSPLVNYSLRQKPCLWSYRSFGWVTSSLTSLIHSKRSGLPLLQQEMVANLVLEL